MKKALFTLMMAAMTLSAAAQNQPRSIGGRIGYGTALTYQHKVAADRMVTADLGLPNFCNGGFIMDAVATHDWINPFGAKLPWDTPKGVWNWYLGVGGGITAANKLFGFGVAGRAGIEYNFWFPLHISVDYRPVIGPQFSPNATGFNTGAVYSGHTFGINVRYMFSL